MVRVVVWSDYICPFCFIGHDRVRRLKEDFPEVEIEWRGFEIHPNVPPEGAPLERVIGPAYASIAQRTVSRAAADSGLTPIVPPFVANSRRAHQASDLARGEGVFHEFHDGVMRAYWERSENIGDERVLLDVWGSAGGDRAALETFFRETPPEATDRWSEAADAGVTGVPTFDVLGETRKRRVVGAQPYEIIKRAVEDALLADSGVEA